MNRRLIAFLLTLGIAALLIVNSAGFFFHQPYYESWDMAANSLSIERAKHFAEWYGPYSRWGFHHPGPAFFYALAWGEWLFHDLLRLTPAPYNAQVLAQVGVSTAFYGAALAVFARRLTARGGAWVFWPLAVAAGALHFGFAAGLPSYDFLRGPSAFTSTWSAHEIVMPFLCLLAAGASVAAGDGQDLPLLAVSAGMLLHVHVAQPLFVGPLTLLAYAGLAWTCARRGEAAWRVFRGRHVAAGLILAVFALPLVLDVFRGADSNVAAILHHVRTHHGEHKSLSKSLLYFLQFGAYAPYTPGRLDFGHFDGAGVLLYLRGHALIYGCWLAVSLGVIGIALRRRLAGEGEESVARARFLTWGGAFLLAGIMLTLFWGTIQDGEMFYYNAWLNFSLYYFGLLIGTTELSAWLDARTHGWAGRLVPATLAVAVCLLLADRWRVRDAVPETTVLLHESIRRVLDATHADAPPGRPPAFDFPSEEWPVAAAVALELTRAGRPFEVRKRWANEFGDEHAGHLTPDRRRAWVPWKFQAGPDAVPWQSNAPELLAPTTHGLRERLAAGAAPADESDFPLPDDTHLSTAVPMIQWSDDHTSEINFQRGGDAARYLFDGWSDAEPWGTWSDGKRSSLHFRSAYKALPGDVEMTVEMHPFVAPAAGLTAQRVRLRFDGETLGPERRAVEDAPLVWTIPAEKWDRAAYSLVGVVLEFEWPDAVSPAALDRTGHTGDTRLLGVGVSRIRFRAVPAVSETR